MATHHRYAVVQGHRMFYREAGDPSKPTVVLLHGYPASSFLFRNLIPKLEDQFHVIAPDALGYGFSDAPSVEEFDYTWENQAGLTSGLLSQLGVRDYSMFVHGDGANIGWRLAVNNPDAVNAIVTQGGIGHESGFTQQFWQPVWDYARNPNPQTEAALRPAMNCHSIMWQYQHGVEDSSLVSPDTWQHDSAMLGRPGSDQIQLAMWRDYPNNFPVYEQLHDYLQKSQVPLMAIWGQGDEIASPVGALAFQTNLANAEVHLLDGGHFLVENSLGGVADRMKQFLGQKRGVASVALIAGLAAGPIAGASAAAASSGPPAPSNTPAATQVVQEATHQAAGGGGQQQQPAAPSTDQLMPQGEPSADSQSSLNLNQDQINNAHAIVNAANAMHLPPRAAVIAVATSMQETKLVNYGDLGSANDHDSLGLFQQRPSSGWGSPDQLKDPNYAATAFLKSLTQIPGWDKMALTDAAQTVQVSAFGDRYAQWEKQASDLVLSTYHAGPYAGK
jgi:pimeloyl-ACP methyl ester carboxylesterase